MAMKEDKRMGEPKTATSETIDSMQRTNLRQRRATAMTASIMRVIEPYLDRSNHYVRRDAYEALISLFMEKGVDVITDHDRAAAGLPFRGNDGWTVDEAVAMENARLASLLRPITFVMEKPQ